MCAENFTPSSGVPVASAISACGWMWRAGEGEGEGEEGMRIATVREQKNVAANTHRPTTVCVGAAGESGGGQEWEEEVGVVVHRPAPAECVGRRLLHHEVRHHTQSCVHSRPHVEVGGELVDWTCHLSERGAGGGGGELRRAAAGGRRRVRPLRQRALSPRPEPAPLAAAAMEMEHFIETVRKYACLWNTTAIEYRDQELKDAAWAEVMKETGLASVKEVKLKWKKLRDSYRDALKRQSEMLAKDPGNPAKKSYPWKYMGPMQFLQPHMSVRKKPAASPPYAPPDAACLVPNGDARSSDDSESEAGSSARKPDPLALLGRQLDHLCRPAKRARREPALPPPAAPDPLDIFFNSMCQSTKRFPYPTQIKIKKTLFGAVIEAEEALVAEQQSYASLWARGACSSSSSEPAEDDEDRKPS